MHRRDNAHKALQTALEWRIVVENLEQWDSEPDGRLEVSEQIKRLIAAIRKEEPKWSVGTHRISAAVAREVYILCKFCDHAGVWPNGLLDALRLVLNVPATATMTTSGNHTNTQTPQMRAVAEYWGKHPDASNSEVGRHVLNSRDKPIGTTGVKQLLDNVRHPGFAEYVDGLKAAAKKRAVKSAPMPGTAKLKRTITARNMPYPGAAIDRTKLTSLAMRQDQKKRQPR